MNLDHPLLVIAIGDAAPVCRKLSHSIFWWLAGSLLVGGVGYVIENRLSFLVVWRQSFRWPVECLMQICRKLGGVVDTHDTL